MERSMDTMDGTREKEINNLPPQAATLLKHMREFGAITAYEALKLYGMGHITRPIYRLEKAGYSIDKTQIWVDRPDGSKQEHTRYSLST